MAAARCPLPAFDLNTSKNVTRSTFLSVFVDQNNLFVTFYFIHVCVNSISDFTQSKISIKYKLKTKENFIGSGE